MHFFFQTVNILADLFSLLIVVRVLMSWFVRNPNQNWLTRFIHETTEPVLKPIRRALPRLGMIDLSPIIAILLIEVIRNLINSFL